MAAPRIHQNPTLDEFGNNLTQLATEAKLDLVVGRHNEIDRVIQILGRRTKNNPVLIGEPGVGGPPSLKVWPSAFSRATSPTSLKTSVS